MRALVITEHGPPEVLRVQQRPDPRPGSGQVRVTMRAAVVGAEVYGTASPGKHDAIRSFGVDHAIDYRGKDVVKEVRRIAGEKQPLDLALDPIGGRSFRKSFSLLRPGGRLVCFGASEIQSGERRSPLRALRTLAEMPRHNVVRLMSQSKSVIGLNMLALWDSKQSLDEYIEPLSGWPEQGDIRPVVAQSFALEDGPAAHRYLHERRNIGKVVLEP